MELFWVNHPQMVFNLVHLYIHVYISRQKYSNGKLALCRLHMPQNAEVYYRTYVHL